MSYLDQKELHTGTITTELREAEFDMVVESRDDAADDVLVLTLRERQGAALPPWEPGAHVDLIVPGIGPRQYSLCGDPSDRDVWRVGILNVADGRGGSQSLHANTTLGSQVQVRGPRNHFRLLPSARYLFIAGGIGITPILPMVAEAERIGADWRLTYGGRTLSSMAFVDELATYGDRVTFWPEDENGFIEVAALLANSQNDTKVYCCGPAALLDVAEQASAHWPAGSLHLERFVARTVAEPARAESFEIELRQSGKTLSVPPDKSILEVVEDAGVPVLWSCGVGTCGTCETPVLDGAIEHRDSILDAEERAVGDCMMICVSRCSGEKLVLDL